MTTSSPTETPVDAGPHLRDDAGAVGAQHRRQRAGPALADPHLAVVQRRADEVNHDVAGPGLGVGHLRRLQDLRAPERGEVDDPHASSPNRSASASKISR